MPGNKNDDIPLLYWQMPTHDDADAAPGYYQTACGRFRLIPNGDTFDVFSRQENKVLATWHTELAAKRHLAALYHGSAKKRARPGR